MNNMLSQAQTLRPAEWVFPGHPDKLADAVADALVLEAMKREDKAICAVEVAVHRDRVYLTGRIACEGSEQIDLVGTVRRVFESAGYGQRWRPAPHELRVEGNICLDTLLPGEADIRHLSDDQSITIGYANNLDSIGNIPPEQWLVRELSKELYALVNSPLELCPDGKVLLVLAETCNAMRIHSVSASLLAPNHVSGIELQREVTQALRRLIAKASPLLPTLLPEIPEHIVVNGGGNFLIGGPEGDNGLSGKKLLLDYYGPRVQIGGSALCGKDLFKPDRAGAYMARDIALSLIGPEVSEAKVSLVSYPGWTGPVVMAVQTDEHCTRLLDSAWTQKVGSIRPTFLQYQQKLCHLDLIKASRFGYF
jgi:S-adenosylmethionine synthetase